MIQLHDTLARAKRPFEPQDPERITMYVCGPTVYGRAHVGNARPAVVFDTLARLIRHQFGPDSLVYARNVTDVDDKIIAAAEAEGVDASVITERYERLYLEDMGALGVRPPDIAPHATQEVPAMIAMIERLIATGNAYEAEGHVLFSVPSDPDYGILSRRDREAMIAGARVEVAPYKRDPADFVLWKPSPPGVVGWDSPWGRGRPGWHIECSAMIRAHLGETIDIHGGGLDLIFPHHENEIAQSRCAHGGAPLARYWVHNGFVDMGAEKMSKSLGNIVTVGELLEQGHRGEVLRLALLSAHYRQPLAWTESLIQSSKSRLGRWYTAVMLSSARVFPVKPSKSVIEALEDDLNTPKALALLDELSTHILNLRTKLDGAAFVEDWEEFRLINASMKRHARLLVSSARVLGLLRSGAIPWITGKRLRGLKRTKSKMLTGRKIESWIAARDDAKARRDFAEADRIRAELKAEGILLEDGPSGTSWRRA